MTITILGAGAFGSALGKILTDNHHDVKYYDPYLYPDTNLERATDKTDAVIITIPSAAIPDFLTSYPNRLKTLPTILASKGLDNPDIFKDFAQFSVISGPGFAQEILDGKPTTFTASAPFALGIFKNDQVQVELQDDPLGIMLCGTLKNIYAIGTGYHSDSENDSAIFVQHAHAEMQKYLEDHGANPRTTELACGIGDLIATCTNKTSRNFTCGVYLREGRGLPEILSELKTVEGLSALERVDRDNYPLINEVYNRANQAQIN